MPKPKSVPAYRHHKPSGRALVRLDGRDVYLGKHGTTEARAEYDRVIAEWLLRGLRFRRGRLRVRCCVIHARVDMLIAQSM